MKEATAGTASHPIIPMFRSRFEETASFWKWCEDSWILELFCMFVSCCAMLAIITMLLVLDHKPSGYWNFFITLNGTISILSVISQSTMMVAVVECVAQQKWLWFQRERSLRETKPFDDTIRGDLIQSFKLICKVRSLAAIGAAIILGNMAFGTFLQQIVNYPEERSITASDQVVSQRATQYVQAPGNNVLPWRARVALDASILVPTSSYTYAPTCSAGNCTWDPFSSLAVSAVCKNLTWTTDCIDNHDNFWNCSYSSPDVGNIPILADFSGEYGIGYQYISTTSIPVNVSSNLLGINNPIIIFASIFFNRNNKTILYNTTPLFSNICSLYWSVQTWNVSVKNAYTQHTSILNTWYNNTPATKSTSLFDASSYHNLSLCPSPKDLHLPANSSNECFLVNSNAQATMAKELSNRFSGNESTWRNGSTWADNTTHDDITLQLTRNDDTNIVTSVALALSQYLREKSDVNATGYAITFKPTITVRWAWITLPVVLIVTSMFLLITTMYASRGSVLWKSSNLVLLLYGPGSTDEETGNHKSSKIEESAENVTMKVQQNDGKWRLVLRDATMEASKKATKDDQESGGKAVANVRVPQPGGAEEPKKTVENIHEPDADVSSIIDVQRSGAGFTGDERSISDHRVAPVS